ATTGGPWAPRLVQGVVLGQLLMASAPALPNMAASPPRARASPAQKSSVRMPEPVRASDWLTWVLPTPEAGRENCSPATLVATVEVVVAGGAVVVVGAAVVVVVWGTVVVVVMSGVDVVVVCGTVVVVVLGTVVVVTSPGVDVVV